MSEAVRGKTRSIVIHSEGGGNGQIGGARGGNCLPSGGTPMEAGQKGPLKSL